MSEIAAVEYRPWRVENTDRQWYDEVRVITEDDEGNVIGEEVTPGYWGDSEGNPAELYLQWQIKTTTYFKEDTELDEMIVSRGGNEPAIIIEMLDDKGVFQYTMMLEYVVDGQPYRSNGPTNVEGHPNRAVAEYMWNNRTMAEGLQVTYAQGKITEKQYNEGMQKYADLPTFEDNPQRAVQLLKQRSNHDLPFKQDVEYIVGVLDDAAKKI